jgi:2-keto-3-deoxy-L-rhamnonate aldolase RhmA
MIRELEKARKFKAKLPAGQVCLGAQIALSDPAVVEIFGRAGYDWLIIDGEHSAHTPSILKSMLLAGATTDAVVLARPARLDDGEINRALDLGASGILCPFISTGEDAKRLARACLYPPEGLRSYGPRRAGGYGVDADEYFKQANTGIICLPIIETPDAVTNIDEIVATPGIDGVVIGPLDLSISLGCYRDFGHASYVGAIDIVRQACQSHGKAMGHGCYSIEHARHCRSLGDTLLLVASDDGFLATEATRVMNLITEPQTATQGT